MASSLAWPAASSLCAPSGPLAPRLCLQNDSRRDRAERKDFVQSFQVASPKENPALKPGEILKACSAFEVFLTPEASEMTENTTEAVVLYTEPSVYDRDQSLRIASRRVRELAKPIEPGENVKAQIRKAHRSLLKVLPSIKFSRVEDIWHADRRIQIRGHEADGIFARWRAVAKAAVNE